MIEYKLPSLLSPVCNNKLAAQSSKKWCGSSTSKLNFKNLQTIISHSIKLSLNFQYV